LMVLSMTINAPAHLEFRDRNQISDVRVRDEIELVDFFDRPVAGLAFDARLDVAVMPKLDVLGKAMNLDPFDRLLLFPMIFQDSNAFDLIVFGRKLRMTAHAEFDGGNAGGLGFVRPRMAVETVDLELTGMMLVAERNRLLRSRRFGIPGGNRRPTRTRRRPFLVELSRDLDLEIRIVFLSSAKLMRFADTAGDENVTVRCNGFSACRSRPTGPEHESRDGNDARGSYSEPISLRGVPRKGGLICGMRHRLGLPIDVEFEVEHKTRRCLSAGERGERRVRSLPQ